MKSHILAFLFSLVLIASFSGCGGSGSDSSSDDSSNTTSTGYVLSDYLNFDNKHNESWSIYKVNKSAIFATMSVDIDPLVGGAVNVYKTINGSLNSFNYQKLSTGEYIWNWHDAPSGSSDTYFTTIFGEGILLFPKQLEVGKETRKDYSNIVGNTQYEGYVTVIIDEHKDSFTNTAGTFSDVLKITWKYYNAGESSPTFSYIYYLAKDLGIIQEVDSIHSYISVRTDISNNTAPTISTIADQSSDEGVAITTINVSASDADSGDTLTYSATGLPTGLSIDSLTGAISGTPTTAGTYSVTVSVSDGTESASTSFTYTVNAVVVSINLDVNSTQVILPDTGKTRTNFATQVSVDGAYVVVASVDENTTQNSTYKGGVVYVYKYDVNNTLNKVYKIESNDVADFDDFGSSVAIDGDYIVIGDTGKNNDDYYDSGAAYVFKNDGNDTFTQVAKLVVDVSEDYVGFGTSVAIDGNYTIVGDEKGSAYIFKNDGSDNFTQLNKLVADDADGDSENFGRNVAISGDFVFVTSASDDPSDRTSAGSVYIYKNDGADNFVQNQKIVSDTSGYYDYFGASISVDGNYLVVGESSGGVSVTSSGSVDIFKKSDVNDSFIFLSTLEANDAEAYSYFGGSVSIRGDFIAVGAYYKDFNSTKTDVGAVYVFENDGSDTFNQVFKITDSNATKDYHIGFSVALSDLGVVAGSYTSYPTGALYSYITSTDGTTITHNGITYGKVTSPYTGRVWLDRNLGATKVCEAYDDSDCYGDNYQWGRNTDGHEKIDSSLTSTRADNISNVGHSNFIKGSGDWSDIDSNIDINGTLRAAQWSKTDGTSVCPSGYRVPTKAELEAETIDEGIEDRDDAYSNFLKLPTGKFRIWSDATISNEDAGLWTATNEGSNSWALYYYSSGAWMANYDRADGFAVRCIKDN
jgi:uncharacterized protein (TIGR02145 family)